MTETDLYYMGSLWLVIKMQLEYSSALMYLYFLEPDCTFTFYMHFSCTSSILTVQVFFFF